MATTRLTDSSIRKAIQHARDTGVRVELTDAATPGLRIRITRDGRATWSVMTRDMTGRNRRFNLGEFPVMGISEAREQAGVTRHKVRHEGVDPVAEKRAARQQAEAEKNAEPEMTLGDMLQLWGAQTGSNQKRAWYDRGKRINDVFKSVLGQPCSTLSSERLQIIADGWSSPSSAAAAVRYLRPVLKWGAKRKYVPAETALIEPPRKPAKRTRWLSRDELASIVPYLRQNAEHSSRAAVMILLLYTATRLNEAVQAEWSEFDLEAVPPRWVIPGGRIKDTRGDGRAVADHVIPLSRQAAEFVDSIRKGRTTGFVFVGARGGLPSRWDWYGKKVMSETGTNGWTRHDLRRTAATWMGELGIPPYITEAVLNHADIHSPLSGIYNRSKYIKEVGEALQVWADFLDTI